MYAKNRSYLMILWWLVCCAAGRSEGKALSMRLVFKCPRFPLERHELGLLRWRRRRRRWRHRLRREGDQREGALQAHKKEGVTATDGAPCPLVPQQQRIELPRRPVSPPSWRLPQRPSWRTPQLPTRPPPHWGPPQTVEAAPQAARRLASRPAGRHTAS